MDTVYLNAVNTEVLAIQRRLMDYAQKHPKIAARLRLGTDIGSDPHVARVIQAYAMLIARTRCRVEDAFPEIIEPIIQATIHPHLHAVPSLAIAELHVDPSQPPDGAGVVMPRGSELETELVDGRTCRFRTCADVALWPVQLESAGVVFPPFASTHRDVAASSCAVRLSLTSMAGNIPLSETELDRLTFYIHDDFEDALRIHDTLCCDVVGVQIVTPAGERKVLPPECIQPLGFEHDERLLEATGQPDGERLLSEFVLLPERFLFFEVTGLRSVFAQLDEVSVQINILLKSTSEHFPKRMANDSIRLNCVPVVNLFTATTEPAEVDRLHSDVTLVVDSRNPDNNRIHEIRQVTVRGEDETVQQLPALHNFGHETIRAAHSTYWLTLPDFNVESAIRFVDLSGRTASLEPGIVEARVLCSNGNIPNRLSADDKLQKLQPTTPGLVAECRFLTRPTPLLTSVPLEAAQQSISRSLPQPTSKSGTAELVAELKEFLQMLVRDTESVTTAMVQSIESASVHRVSGIHGQRMVCHGLEVRITLDDHKSLSGGMFLFAEILRHVFARYATQNTFVRYRVTTTSGRKYGPWPTIAGERFNV